MKIMINCRPVANKYSSFSLWPEVILSLGFLLNTVFVSKSSPGSCLWQEAAMLQQRHFWTMVRLNVLSPLPPCPAVCVCVCVFVSACRDYCCSHVGLCPTLQAVTVSQAGKKVSGGDGSGSCPLPLPWAKTLDFKTHQTDTNFWIPFKHFDGTGRHSNLLIFGVCQNRLRPLLSG